MTDNELPDYWHKFWQIYADSFVAPLKSNELLSNLVANTNVTGLYAEAWIRSLTKKMLPQFRISTGAVIRPSDQARGLRSVPQCDLIIWDPSQLPAIFEEGEFALVPTHSVHGIIEIKRSCSDTGKLVKQLQARRNLIRAKCRNNILGVVVENPKPLFDGEVKPDWLESARWIKDYPLVGMLSRDMMPHNNDIMAFIYFLSQVAGHTEIAS